MSKTNITKEQIKHLASLAQLDLSDAEVGKFSTQLTSILQYIDRIKEVKLSDKVQRDFKKLNTFREDENPHKAGEHRNAILEAMPEVENSMLVVKKVLSK